MLEYSHALKKKKCLLMFLEVKICRMMKKYDSFMIPTRRNNHCYQFGIFSSTSCIYVNILLYS